MREFLEYLARALVDDPERVRVEEYSEDDGTLVLELSVGEDDYGQVIGRGGRTAQALRALLRSRGDALGISYDLKIREPGESPDRQDRR